MYFHHFFFIITHCLLRPAVWTVYLCSVVDCSFVCIIESRVIFK